jgi:ubiquinone/menaquinone biosynthesis C-methylase UbiE
VSFYENRLLPRIIDIGLGNRYVSEERKKALSEASGEVLEIGFGTGLNLPHYPGTLKRLVALDPSEGSKRIAKDRIDRAPFPVEHIALSGEEIPSDDQRFDTVVSTFTMCTIPNIDRALQDVRRVLKVGGKLLFVEHGRADSQTVARWQSRLNPIQQVLFGGCHLDREIDRLIRQSGLTIDRLEKYYMNGPPLARGPGRVFSYLYTGRAMRL